ncbi:hypothetical protein F9Y25_10220 [Salmonella enterica subsp. enterica]|nr:hypothetical protein [Salmonella enterica subsp. enterica serovar Kottbus]
MNEIYLVLFIKFINSII